MCTNKRSLNNNFDELVSFLENRRIMEWMTKGLLNSTRKKHEISKKVKKILKKRKITITITRINYIKIN